MNIFMCVIALLGFMSFSSLKSEELSDCHCYIACKLLQVINRSCDKEKRAAFKVIAAALMKFSKRSSVEELIRYRTAWILFGDIMKCIYLLECLGEETGWTQEYYASLAVQESACAYQQAAMNSYDSAAAYSAASYPR